MYLGMRSRGYESIGDLCASCLHVWLGKNGNFGKGQNSGVDVTVSTSTWCSSHRKESAMPGTA